MKYKMFGYRKRGKGSDREERMPSGMDKDGPPDYEGKEHVRYENPGFSRHHIRFPEDEPHMKSHVTREEEHEMEDNYHMGIPDQTEESLPAKIKRARMGMDARNQQDPKPIRGNPVTNVGYRGEEDTSGEEQEGPHDMQMDSRSRKNSKQRESRPREESEYGMEDEHMESDEEEMPKEQRKKMIVSVMKRKMKKRHGSGMSRE